MITINKKLVLSKTVLFIIIVLFISGFQKIFTTENTLIGVCVITASLMLLDRDLTLSPVKYLFYLIGLNLFLGVSAFLASQNLWLGIPINFIAIFVIGFILSYDLKSNLYVPFGLQYLFMLSVPVAPKDLGVRLFSLVFGAVLVILLQLICNKNRLVKSGDKLLQNLFTHINEKIQLVIENKDTSDLDITIKKDIGDLKKLVYNKRKNFYYLTEYGKITLNICATLESLNFKIDNLYKDYSQNDIHIILNNLSGTLNNIIENKKDPDLLKSILCENRITHVCAIDDKLNIICRYFIDLNNLENPNKVNNDHPIPTNFDFSYIMKNNFSIKSMKFSYAFRLALCIAVSIFIMDFFKIYEGRWIAFTVFALIQPYAENSIIKTKQRLKGTLIGGTLFFILFSIIKDPTARSLIVMFMGYIDSYNTRYDRKIICITISALGVASLTSSVESLVIYRFFFVGIGMIFALFANKYIFPYSLKDASRNLIAMSSSIANHMVKEVQLYLNQKSNNHSIENLFMIFSMLDDNIAVKENIHWKNSIESKKELINNVYEIYVHSQFKNPSHNEYKYLMNLK